MKEENIRELKAKSQRLETLISQFDADVQLLENGGVSVKENDDIAERQEEIQDEIEQTLTDLLLLLDMSGQIEVDGTVVDLPENGRQPVSQGTLPEPSFDRPDRRGPPPWAGSGNDNNSDNGPQN